VPKILVIDDDAAYRMLLSFWLGRAGHETTVASDGRLGVALAREQKFDLVITDIFMPELDGFETIALLRRENLHIPILAISGGSSAMDYKFYLRSAQALGANDTLAKPFTSNDLASMVSRLVYEATADQAAAPTAKAQTP
jgi:CheY-like chemotaxis protein